MEALRKKQQLLQQLFTMMKAVYSPLNEAARWLAKYELIAIHGWGAAHEGQYVKQVDYTYNVVGLMNEKQVTLVETTFDGRLELVNHEGLLNYFSLMRLALQCSSTAREAIKCMAELVEEYGYNSSGESITIGDFQRWSHDTPGYDQQLIDAIGPATGDRYKLNKVIERRER